MNVKKHIRVLGCLSLLVLIFPTTSFAETATTTYSYSNWQTYRDGSDESRSTRRDRIRGYRQQSSELQQKITTLGSSVVQAVPVPVLFGVTLNNISPNFGDPRDGGARTHEGEDIMAVKGTPIVSPTPSVVLRTGTGTSEGNYVYTANPGGETFVYMHLDKIGEGIVAGQVLAKGDLLGYVGNTGNASGGAAHLHFEIHDSNNNPVDPYPRLSVELTLQEKITDLFSLLTKTSDAAALSQLLVANFRSTFVSAQSQGILLPSQITAVLGTVNIPVASTGKVVITRNLYRGITGEDVRGLQRLLNANGFVVSSTGAGSVGNETTYFGSATEAAVIRFQIAKGITPVAGYVGPITRAALATL